jgi:AcrR family transcriptional regulator
MPADTATLPTRQRLREAAIELVAAHGLMGLSVRTLCRAVGIRESSFYAHFDSKDTLLDELLVLAGADAPLRVAERLAAEALSLSAYVRQLISELTTLWTDPVGRKLRVLLEAEVARDPARRERFNQGVLAMIASVARVLQQHIDRHALVQHAPADVLAWSLVAPVAAMRFSLFAHGASTEHLERGRRLASELADGWLRAHERRTDGANG